MRNSVVITNIVCLRVVLPSAQASFNFCIYFCFFVHIVFIMILEVNIFISTVVHVPNVIMNKGIPLSVCVDALTFNPC